MRKVSTVPFQALVSPLADDRLEVAAERAHQQEVGVEPALVEIEDVVAARSNRSPAFSMMCWSITAESEP
jgi:hypothetical protein